MTRDRIAGLSSNTLSPSGRPITTPSVPQRRNVERSPVVTPTVTSRRSVSSPVATVSSPKTSTPTNRVITERAPTSQRVSVSTSRSLPSTQRLSSVSVPTVDRSQRPGAPVSTPLTTQSHDEFIKKWVGRKSRPTTALRVSEV